MLQQHAETEAWWMLKLINKSEWWGGLGKVALKQLLSPVLLSHYLIFDDSFPSFRPLFFFHLRLHSSF